MKRSTAKRFTEQEPMIEGNGRIDEPETSEKQIIYTNENRKPNMRKLYFRKLDKTITASASFEAALRLIQKRLASLNLSPRYQRDVREKLGAIYNFYGIHSPSQYNLDRLIRKMKENGRKDSTMASYYYIIQHWAIALGQEPPKPPEFKFEENERSYT